MKRMDSYTIAVHQLLLAILRAVRVSRDPIARPFLSEIAMLLDVVASDSSISTQCLELMVSRR
jgi:hypothetical protein